MDNNTNTPQQTPEPTQSKPPEPAPIQTPGLQTPPVMPQGPSMEPQATPDSHANKSFVPWIFIILAVIILVIAGYFFLRSVSKPATPHLKIGVMEAFSGGSSAMGYGAMKGIRLAQKDLGADNVELVQMDSKCDPKVSPQAIKKLVEQGVVAIIGEGCSSASVAALPTANNSKVVMISPSASSPALSIPDDYFFRVVPPDNYQGAFMAQAVYDKGIRRVAVFYTNEPYGQGISRVFKEKFESLGGKVVVTTPAEPDVINLSNQIADIKAANPQAVFFAPNSVVSAAAAIKLARQAGITAPFYGGDLLYDKTLINNAPTAVEGLTVTSFPTGSKAFKQELLNFYQVSEQLYAASQAYDAFKSLYLSIQQGATTGEDIKRILPSINFDGVSAHISFDQNGEIPGKNYKYELLQVKEGTFVTVNP